MNSIAFAVIVLVVLGLAGGIILVLASKFMAVYEDPRIAQITECLAGANCGGCGYAGCADYAKAIVENGAPTNKCAPGGAKATEAVNAIMGTESASGPALHAVVNCNGGNGNCGTRFEYHGIPTCAAAAAIAGGPSACAFGCLGYGDCTRACQFDAIHVVNGSAVVDREKCTGCSACVAACPHHVISLKPMAPQPAVLCSNKDKGPAVMKACKAGCIACGMCVRNCPQQAVTLVNNVAVIDYAKCSSCGTCVTKCPKKVIHWVDGQPAVAGGPSACAFGCLGYGDCTRACQFDAIHVVNGSAVVDREKCTGCSACVAACPHHVISLKPMAPQPAVLCSNKDKGPAVMKACKAGCIACGMCVRNCPQQAVTLVNNVAVIDYAKCSSCGTCVTKCPKKVIHWVDGQPAVAGEPA